MLLSFFFFDLIVHSFVCSVGREGEGRYDVVCEVMGRVLNLLCLILFFSISIRYGINVQAI